MRLKLAAPPQLGHFRCHGPPPRRPTQRVHSRWPRGNEHDVTDDVFAAISRRNQTRMSSTAACFHAGQRLLIHDAGLVRGHRPNQPYDGHARGPPSTGMVSVGRFRFPVLLKAGPCKFGYGQASTVTSSRCTGLLHMEAKRTLMVSTNAVQHNSSYMMAMLHSNCAQSPTRACKKKQLDA